MKYNIKIYFFISTMISSLLLAIGLLWDLKFIDFIRLLFSGFFLGYPVSFFILVLFKKKGIKIDELN